MPENPSRASTNNWRDQWILRPGVTYLNHGSFGPSPKPVIAARQDWIERLESEPMDFFVRQMEGHLEHARERLGQVVGTGGENLVLVDNATFGMNIVASSFPLTAGDEIVTTNHEYGAVLRIWRERCQKAGAKLVVQKLPESFVDAAEVVAALFAGVSARTKLIVVSHITSPTALILPVAEICRRAKERKLPVCIDGPHALAAVSIELDRLGCDFYCASCHKWLSAPFGSGFLYVHPRWKQSVQPLVVSWGNSLSGRPRSWQDEFVWSGTRDPSPFLAVPAAINFLAGLSPRWAADEAIDIFRGISHRLVDLAQRKITALTALAPIGAPPHEWYGTMITLPLPDGIGEVPHGQTHPLQAALWERFQIEAPVVNWNGRRHIRVSCHLYNDEGDIDRLAMALGELLGEPGA
jgi:isopenicillin-N epimerase